MSNSPDGKSPLQGFRALDLTDEKGFLCGKILADLGVDVIKVEPPGGDPSRNIGPFYGGQPDPEKSLLWFAYNTGKRGITLDVTAPEGRDAFLELAKGADFVIESYPPGYLAGLGLGYDDLAAANPGIILASISGFGQTGPYASFEAPDIVCMATSGYMNLVGNPNRPPVRISVPQSYLHAAGEAAVGCLFALWHRERTGHGQHVDASAQQAVAWDEFHNQNFWDMRRINLKRLGGDRMYGRLTYRLIYECLDGYIIFAMFGGTAAAKRHRALVAWMEEEGTVDPFLHDFDWESWPSPTVTEATARALEAHLEAFFKTKTKRQLFEAALTRGCLIAPINSIRDMIADPHLEDRRFWQEIAHPELGVTIRYPGAPYKSVESPYRAARRAPLVGEHNAEVLAGPANIIHGPITISPRELPVPSFPRKRESTVPSHAIPAETGIYVSPDPNTSSTAGDRDPGSIPRQDSADPPAALDGVKVVDFTWSGVGPATARYFADHGATVVRVENVAHPDMMRQTGPFKDDVPGLDHGSYFANYNCNKVSITLDLGVPEGMAIARRLIDWADICVESFTPGIVKRLGIDYESVKVSNPGLIYASTSQMGQTGPHRLYGGYGLQAAAIAGFNEITGWPDLPPDMPFLSYTDFVAHRYLIGALMAALFHRAATGRGQFIDQSQSESGLQFLAVPILDYQANGTVTTRCGNRDPYAAPHGAFRCAGEDRWCVIAVFDDDEWHSLCRVIGRPQLATDPRFATLALRKAHEAELEGIVEQWTASLPTATVMSSLQSAGVPAGVVATAEDMHRDPQLAHRGHFWIFDHPVIGPHTVESPAMRLSRTPARQYRRAPTIGEHNEQVCTQILQMSDEEFVAALVAGAFG